MLMLDGSRADRHVPGMLDTGFAQSGAADDGELPASPADALLHLAERLPGEGATLGDLVDALGPAGLGLTLIALALPAFIPSPGLPTGLVFGTAIGLLSLQVMAGARQLTLPMWLRRRSVPRSFVVRCARWVEPWLRRVESRLRPRLLAMTGRKGRRATALLLLVLAVIILLPVPFGNQLPALAIIVLALALLTRDGLAAWAGVGIAALGIAWNVAIFAFGVELVQLAV